jgi:hypothetical protein
MLHHVLAQRFAALVARRLTALGMFALAAGAKCLPPEHPYRVFHNSRTDVYDAAWRRKVIRPLGAPGSRPQSGHRRRLRVAPVMAAASLLVLYVLLEL